MRMLIRVELEFDLSYEMCIKAQLVGSSSELEIKHELFENDIEAESSSS
jgi:hypothetical protein